MDVVGGREAGLAIAVQHAGPVVIGSGDAGAQGDGHFLAAEALGNLAGHANVTLVVDFTGVQVGVLGLNAEDVLGVLLIGDADVHVGDQLAHDAVGLFAGPQLAAVVQVTGNGQAQLLGLLAGLQADGGQLAAQCGSNAGEVEPVGTLEDLVPVEVGSGGQSDGGTGAVIDDLGSTLRSALLHEIDAQTGTAADDHAGVNAKAAQLVDGALTNLVSGNLGDESSVHAVVGQRHSHVGLAAGIGGLELVGLHETQIALGIQAHHDFAKGNNLLHICFPPDILLKIKRS